MDEEKPPERFTVDVARAREPLGIGSKSATRSMPKRRQAATACPSNRRASIGRQAMVWTEAPGGTIATVTFPNLATACAAPGVSAMAMRAMYPSRARKRVTWRQNVSSPPNRWVVPVRSSQSPSSVACAIGVQCLAACVPSRAIVAVSAAAPNGRTSRSATSAWPAPAASPARVQARARLDRTPRSPASSRWWRRARVEGRPRPPRAAFEIGVS